MSDILRTTAPPEFVGYTSRELARLAHRAEDTADDVLLLQVEDEVERRVRTWGLIWREQYMRHYIDLHRTRGK